MHPKCVKRVVFEKNEEQFLDKKVLGGSTDIFPEKMTPNIVKIELQNFTQNTKNF
jgi:hypothetical protein